MNELYLFTDKLYERAVCDFQYVGKVFISALYIALIVISFVLALMFVLGLVFTFIDFVVSVFKKFQNWRKSRVSDVSKRCCNE